MAFDLLGVRLRKVKVLDVKLWMRILVLKMAAMLSIAVDLLFDVVNHPVLTGSRRIFNIILMMLSHY